MKYFIFAICFLMVVIGTLIYNTDALSYGDPLSSIRFSAGFWDTPNGEIGITIHNTDLGNNERLTDVQVLGLSGMFSFSHMVGNRFAWELAFGGFSDTEGEVIGKKVNVRYNDDYYETISSNSRTVSVSYMTVGLIYYPLYELNGPNTLGGLPSFFRPYLTAGIGPYFGWDAKWNEETMTDTNFSSTMGAYPGIGLDLILSRHFLFNIDARYHLVEFKDPLKGATDYSGVNVVAGFKIAF